MLGQKISDLRKSRGLTQIQFAKEMHVTQGAVSHWENGRALPDTQQLFSISAYFDIPINELTSNGKDIAIPAPEKERKFSRDIREGVELYESLSPSQKKNVLEYMKFLVSQHEND